MQAEFVRPKNLQDALDILANGAHIVAAGCTDLFPATRKKTLAGPVLDITGIHALAGIRTGEGQVRIGAATTWTDLIRKDLPPAFDGLKQAARELGAKQIQNRGTLVGNLCNASPAADGVPPLLTLDAQIELSARHHCRTVPLKDFLKGPRATARARDELVTAIIVPNCEGRSHFMKLGARKYLVISIAMAAARIVECNGVITSAALAIGACGPVATRLPDVEAHLIGRKLNEVAIDEKDVASALSPLDDVRGDAAYRTEGATELLRRLLAQLRQEQPGHSRTDRDGAKA